MTENIIFFIKLGLYIYLALFWLQEFCKQIDKKDNDSLTFDYNTTLVKTQLTCKFLCQTAYSATKDYYNSQQKWMYYLSYQPKSEAVEAIKGKQLEQIADYYKNVCLNIKKLEKAAQQYLILCQEIGCLFRQKNEENSTANQYECYQTTINGKQVKITRSAIKKSLWRTFTQKLIKFLFNYYPESIQQIFAIIFPYFTQTITYIVLLAIFMITPLIIYCLKHIKKASVGQELQCSQLQYGFKFIQYLRQLQRRCIESPFNSLTNNVYGNLRQILQKIEHKKIKLITQTTSGIGISSCVQAWCQQQQMQECRQVIYYDLADQIEDQQFSKKNQVQNVIALLNSVINEDNRQLVNIVEAYVKGFFLYVLFVIRNLLQVSLLSLIALTFISKYFSWKVLAIIIIGKNFTKVQTMFFFTTNWLVSKFYQFVIFFIDKFENPVKKIIVISNIEQLNFDQKSFKYQYDQNDQKDQKDLKKLYSQYNLESILQKISIIQSSKKYDVILISKKRHVSDQIIKTASKNKGKILKFHHKIMFPLSFLGIQRIIQQRSIQQNKEHTRILGLVTNNARDMVQILRNCNSDQKYSSLKFSLIMIISTFIEYLTQPVKIISRNQIQQQISKCLKQAKKELDKFHNQGRKKDVKDQIFKKIIDKIKGKKQNEQNELINEQNKLINQQNKLINQQNEQNKLINEQNEQDEQINEQNEQNKLINEQNQQDEQINEQNEQDEQINLPIQNDNESDDAQIIKLLHAIKGPENNKDSIKKENNKKINNNEELRKFICKWYAYCRKQWVNDKQSLQDWFQNNKNQFFKKSQEKPIQGQLNQGQVKQVQLEQGQLKQALEELNKKQILVNGNFSSIAFALAAQQILQIKLTKQLGQKSNNYNKTIRYKLSLLLKKFNFSKYLLLKVIFLLIACYILFWEIALRFCSYLFSKFINNTLGWGIQCDTSDL